jgi:hypothetical protein
MLRITCLCLLGLVLSIATQQPVLAWADTGHKVVASIAWRQLSPVQQAAMMKLLSEHPRFAQEFMGRLPEDVKQGEEKLQQEWHAQQAAIWPDIAREYKDDVRKQFHRGPWHYINSPLFIHPAEEKELREKLQISNDYQAPESADKIANVIQTIRVARRELKPNSKATPTERAVWLCWLMHTVGDIHQPLHSTASFSKDIFPLGDQGGNLIPLTTKENLHWLWDGFPGGKCTVTEARNDALTLLTKQAELQVIANVQQQLNEEQWMRESQEIALASVYTNEVLSPLRQIKSMEELKKNPLGLTPDYLKTGGMICKRRLIEAGLRLGAILQESFPESK